MATLANIASTGLAKPLQTTQQPVVPGYNANSQLLPGLQGQDLTDLQHTVLTGQYNGALADKLGANYNQYVNQYGVGGANWADTLKSYQPGGTNTSAATSTPGLGGINPVSGSSTPATTSTPTTGTATGSGMPVTDSFGTSPVTGQADPTDWSQLDVNKFLDPSLDFQIQKGNTAIQNSAAAKGSLQSGSTMKAIADYTTGMANQSYQQSVNDALNDRSFQNGAFNTDRNYQTALDQWNQNFNYNTDNTDRNFAYNALVGDRNYNTQTLASLAQLGLGGTNGAADLQSQLARLLSANTIASGQAGAQGTIGGSNAINNIISQLLQQYQGNSTLSGLGIIQ